MKSLVQIVEAGDLSVEKFEEIFLNGEQPVLIKNYMANWKALHWNLVTLKQKAGHNSVFVRRNTSQDSYKVGKKYNIQSMLFSKYIDNLIEGNDVSKSSYLAVQNIGKALPELSEDIEVPKYVKKLHGGPFLWIAQQGHYEFCHFDPDDNFLIVFAGRKRVRLYPAKDIQKLYPNPLGSKGKTIQSRVDCDDPDVESYPHFRDADCIECIINSGEMLFFPAFWWHQVTSTELTISMNIFFGNDGDNAYTSKIMGGHQWDSFKYWLLNIVEQNRDKEQFQKVLQYLDESLKNFLWKQWKESISKEQADQLVKVVLDYLGLCETPQKTVALKHPPPLKIRGLLWRS